MMLRLINHYATKAFAIAPEFSIQLDICMFIEIRHAPPQYSEGWRSFVRSKLYTAREQTNYRKKDSQIKSSGRYFE